MIVYHRFPSGSRWFFVNLAVFHGTISGKNQPFPETIMSRYAMFDPMMDAVAVPRRPVVPVEFKALMTLVMQSSWSGAAREYMKLDEGLQGQFEDLLLAYDRVNGFFRSINLAAAVRIAEGAPLNACIECGTEKEDGTSEFCSSSCADWFCHR